MPRTPRLRVITGLLAPLLAVLFVAPPAQAGPSDPEQPVRLSTPAVAAAAPSTIDSDVVVSRPSPSGRTYFVVAGHLTLKLTAGSMTAYSGTLVDYVGNTSYRATASTSDPSAPTLSFSSTNGKFVFRMDSSFGGTFYTGTGLKIPAGLIKPPASQITITAATHSLRSASYDITMSERSGGFNHPFEYVGTLTLAYDANGRISGGQVTVTDAKGRAVTHPLRNSGYYSAGYFYTVAQVDTTYFGLTATVSGSTISGFGFAGSGPTTSQWVLSGSQ